MKKFLGIVVSVIVVLVILFLLSQGLGFGLGGSGFGKSEGKDSEEKTTQAASTEEPKTDIDEEEVLSKIVTVTIKENQVYVGSKAIADKEELKAYIEEINNDERQFKLKEENSIQATYEWVTDTFEELKIQLVPEK